MTNHGKPWQAIATRDNPCRKPWQTGKARQGTATGKLPSRKQPCHQKAKRYACLCCFTGSTRSSARRALRGTSTTRPRQKLLVAMIKLRPEPVILTNHDATGSTSTERSNSGGNEVPPTVSRDRTTGMKSLTGRTPREQKGWLAVYSSVIQLHHNARKGSVQFDAMPYMYDIRYSDLFLYMPILRTNMKLFSKTKIVPGTYMRWVRTNPPQWLRNSWFSSTANVDHNRPATVPIDKHCRQQYIL